jgi:hypothetical protein
MRIRAHVSSLYSLFIVQPPADAAPDLNDPAPFSDFDTKSVAALILMQAVRTADPVPCIVCLCLYPRVCICVCACMFAYVSVSQDACLSLRVSAEMHVCSQHYSAA